MSDFDLLFRAPLVATHPVDLRFNSGDDAAPENKVVLSAAIDAPTLTSLVFELRRVTLDGLIDAPVLNATVFETVLVSLDAAIDPPTVNVQLLEADRVTMVATIDAPTLTTAFEFNNAVYRGVSRTVGDGWQSSENLNRYLQDKTQTPTNTKAYVSVSTSDCIPIVKPTTIPIDPSVKTKREQKSAWTDGDKIRSSPKVFEHASLVMSRKSRAFFWQLADTVQNSATAVHADLLRKPRVGNITTWSVGVSKGRVSTDPFSVALRKLAQKGSRWTEAARPNYGMYVRPVDPTIPDGYKPPLGGLVNLLFKELATTDTNILFGIRQYVPAKKVIPIRRTYPVINNTDLRLVDTNERIETFSMDMSIDMDSWTWGFSANVAARELPKLLPSAPGEPVLVDALVNGEHFKFLVESTRRSRSFGKDAISISGRGLSATLSDPYSAIVTFTNTQSRTAQQLMNDALTINGVPIGWTVDWQIDDWLVPAGVWSHQGTYMSAITTIATSVGAFVQPDPMTNTLRIKSRNKVKPWDLHSSVADIEIPSAVIETESVTWEDRAKYDSVYVSGTTADGVLGLVRRTGTAGDNSAPMVTDALITDVIAARQRGIFELSRFGSIVKRELNLPVLTESGIIMPGAIVKYTDGGISNTGVVNSVRVNVALPSVRQQISITSYE